MTTLAQAELLRYSRHLILPDVGVPGQEKLKAARVLLIGAGGLGSPAALYLAAAGVGTLGLVDFDNVDVTNLQRQILHGTKDVGRPKLVSARERIADVNPHVRLETYETALTSKNALDILSGYDIVVDGTDNFATRYLVNDACVLLGKPNVYGSIFRFEGPQRALRAARTRSKRSSITSSSAGFAPPKRSHARWVGSSRSRPGNARAGYHGARRCSSSTCASSSSGTSRGFRARGSSRWR